MWDATDTRAFPYTLNYHLGQKNLGCLSSMLETTYECIHLWKLLPWKYSSSGSGCSWLFWLKTDFGSMASDPLKMQALKSCCECLKLDRKAEKLISRKLLAFIFALHAIIVLELYYSLWLSCGMCCTFMEWDIPRYTHLTTRSTSLMNTYQEYSWAVV